MKTTKSKLTANDILKGESDSNGYGLYGHPIRRPAFWLNRSADPYEALRAFDETVAAEAGRQGLDAAGLHAFMDSKAGRHAGDSLSSCPTAEKFALALGKAIADFIKHR